MVRVWKSPLLPLCLVLLMGCAACSLAATERFTLKDQSCVAKAVGEIKVVNPAVTYSVDGLVLTVIDSDENIKEFRENLQKAGLLASATTSSTLVVQVADVSEGANLTTVEQALQALKTISQGQFDFHLVPHGGRGGSSLAVLVGTQGAVTGARALVSALAGPDAEKPVSNTIRLYHARNPSGVAAVLAALAPKIAPHVTVTACGVMGGRAPAVIVAGPREQVALLREMVEGVDVPCPQVRMVMYAVQFSGANRERVHNSALKARQAISSHATAVRKEGARQLSQLSAICTGEALLAAGRDGPFDAAGALADDGAKQLQLLRDPDYRATLRPWLKALGYDPEQKQYMTSEFEANFTGMHFALPQRLGVQLATPSFAARMARAMGDLRDPDSEARRQARAVLQAGGSALQLALAEDIENCLVAELTAELAEIADGADDRGLSYVSQTTSVVISGSKASFTGGTVSYHDVSAPPALAEALAGAQSLGTGIGGLFPATSPAGATPAVPSATPDTLEEETGEAPTAAPEAVKAAMAPLSALSAGMGGIPVDRLLALALAFGEQPRTWSVLKDGVTLNVTPHVLPAGSGAELELELQIAHNTAGEGEPADAPVPLSRVSQHDATTCVYTQAFDLIEISSFTMASTHPRPDCAIPVLGSLPLIGQAFRWPKSPGHVHHESVLAIYTVVIPAMSTPSVPRTKG